MTPRCEVCGEYWDLGGHECKGMKVDIEFTVKPTSDPDVVIVERTGSTIATRARRGDGGTFGIAADKWFQEHPPKPVHPLADTVKGECWTVEFTDGHCHTYHIDHNHEERALSPEGIKSARSVYVLPKDKADSKVRFLDDNGQRGRATDCQRILDGAL